MIARGRTASVLVPEPLGGVGAGGAGQVCDSRVRDDAGVAWPELGVDVGTLECR